MNTPREIDLAITSRCNLRCLYCSHFTSNSEVSEELSTKQLLNFFSECQAARIMRITLSGGEPLIREDLPEIINGITANKMRFRILSNGTLITEKLAEHIASSGRCEFIQISIDSSIPSIHDSCRGKGMFEKAVTGLKILMKYCIPSTVRVTINKVNLCSIRDTAKFLLEDVGLKGFSVNSAGYMGLSRQNSGDIMLDNSERQTAMETLIELKHLYGSRISAAAGPLWEAENWMKMIKAADNSEPQWSEGGALTACGCVFSRLFVRADGYYCICQQIPHSMLGKVGASSLKDAWNHSEMQRMRKRKEISLRTFNECSECRFVHYCTGNCPAIAYNTCGDIYVPNPDSCLKRFLEAEGKVPNC
ncbi:MAG: SynChlorMet cassette radical SAM/SPASM protein ScmE [Candidatus Riflebacteria bacterium]|nr:SynChlorMet cassette radical SAM/SPASM protein ScmE [Candidatus Riflebacteria bacterium]